MEFRKYLEVLALEAALRWSDGEFTSGTDILSIGVKNHAAAAKTAQLKALGEMAYDDYHNAMKEHDEWLKKLS